MIPAKEFEGVMWIKASDHYQELKRAVEAFGLAVAAEREVCAKLVEQVGADGYGTLTAAAMIRKRGEK
jgi:hypothetical protein